MVRTDYMQSLMNETYNKIAIEALKNGFSGSWERLIARQLKRDYDNSNSEAECIIQAVGGVSDQKLMEAANLIIHSKIPKYANK